MFYSQFILAKKGPLGTIWIAAHLERKLKKNQVADTDIGVSVDSILFPEVPIALRLSSHLLLGVVRIYSRKVNYLFHDCSEALLKVKQAFRSTAVDLPPEESTAPYHSITLPETFDLDDFELPDSALFNGNFDDRHVSTREQITLQDPLDGAGYSTSQFGLDERFGDGDASQIGLDPDEELLLDSNVRLRDASVFGSNVHEGATDLAKMDIDKGQYSLDDNGNGETSKELSDLLSNSKGKHVVSNTENLIRIDDSSHQIIFNVQTPDLNEVFLPDKHIGGPSVDMDFGAADPPSPELNEAVNFPVTSGLMEEAIQANSEQTPASNHPNGSPDTSIEAHKLDKPINHEVEYHNGTNEYLIDAASSKAGDVAQEVSSPTSVLAEPKPDSVVPLNNDGQKQAELKNPQSANAVSFISSSLGLSEMDPSSTSELLDGCSAGHDPPCNNLMPSVSTDPERRDNSQVLPSTTSVSTMSVSEPPLPQWSGDTTVAPAVVGSGSTFRAADTLCTSTSCLDENGHPVSLDNSLASEEPANINGSSPEVNNKSSKLDVDHAGDAYPFQTSKLSALSSDFHLRPCSSESNQPHVSASADMSHPNVQELSSVDPQGMHSVISVDTNVVVGEKSNDNSVVLKTVNPAELSSNCISKDVQSGHGNCFSSSEYPEPERMRFATSVDINLSNDLGQLTAEKGIIESDGSVDRISNLSGQKRRLLDSTPDLQNGILPKTSGVPRKKRNSDYIPDDDDILASILVGRRTSALKVGPTPLPKPPPLKRPRLTSKIGLPKRRKVLLDDTMVLHADAIRQQLINTEDIRRMRKKAPCTRPEIWRIQRSSLEDEIFCDIVFTGVSDDLSRLSSRRYDSAKHFSLQIDGQHSSGEARKELDPAKSSVFVREDGREMGVESFEPKWFDADTQGPSGIKLIEAESCRTVVTGEAQQRAESSPNLVRTEPLSSVISSNELDALEQSGADVVRHAATESANGCAVPLDTRIGEKHDDLCANAEQNSLDVSPDNDMLPVANCAVGTGTVNGVLVAAPTNDTVVQMEELSSAKVPSITVEDMGVTNLDGPQDGSTNMDNEEGGGASVSILDRFIVEVGVDFPADSSTVIGHVNSSVPEMGLVDGIPVASNCQSIKESVEANVKSGCETFPVNNEPASKEFCGERPHIASPPVTLTTEGERVPSAVGENSSLNVEGGLDEESTLVELTTIREPSDFCSAIDDIDTDFLNVDDEVEYDEERNNDVPNTEEAQSLENSGWSSRTRGVARYLKNMFDQDSGRGRKSVAMDHLLAGKTRKEASRMFFETLVLKTRDYIHVEQENPFDFVHIKPRVKLLKTQF